MIRSNSQNSKGELEKRKGREERIRRKGREGLEKVRRNGRGIGRETKAVRQWKTGCDDGWEKDGDEKEEE